VSRASRAVPEVLAAVDLGSNSFHLVVARYSHGQLVVIDRLREMVRLGAGVGEDGRIDKEAAARALACLQRFGQRLRDMHARSVRVVGTNALRVARRKQAFLERAREALGHPLEIVSGMEEARLIYSGVSHTLPAEPGRRLVVDIGGGSTEMIVGEAEPAAARAAINCVSRHFMATASSRPNASRARSRPSARAGAGGLRRGWDQPSAPAPCAIAEVRSSIRPALMPQRTRRCSKRWSTRATCARSSSGP
jgi:exopolyphosphatase/guanosine-5'-triphosphate,3'-diphosphate pyrophosphatase